jgi:hypothetical protein
MKLKNIVQMAVKAINVAVKTGLLDGVLENKPKADRKPPNRGKRNRRRRSERPKTK